MAKGSKIAVRAVRPTSEGSDPSIYLGLGDDNYLVEPGPARELVKTLRRGIQDAPEFPPGVLIHLGIATYGIARDGAGRLVDAIEREIREASSQ